MVIVGRGKGGGGGGKGWAAGCESTRSRGHFAR